MCYGGMWFLLFTWLCLGVAVVCAQGGKSGDVDRFLSKAKSLACAKYCPLCDGQRCGGMQRAAGLLGIMSDSSKSEAMWLECPGDIYIYIYLWIITDR
jgi:hypothetical protein